MAQYRLALASLGTAGLGTVLVSDLFAEGYPESGTILSYTDVLNAPGSITFTLPIDTTLISFDEPGKRELHLYRDDGGGEVLWRTYRLTVGSLDSRVGVRFAGEGFYGVLRHREIRDDKVYNVPNGGPWLDIDIAWDLIDYTQGVNPKPLGVTRGAIVGAGTTRTKFWCAGDTKIADAIEDLSAADDGFDFDVSPNKEWLTWSSRRGSVTALVFDAATNVEDISGLDVDATEVESEVGGIIDSGDCTPANILSTSDSGSLADFGLLQGSLSGDESDLLTAQMAEELLRAKRPRLQPVMGYHADLTDAIQIDEFELGDEVIGQASLGWATFSDGFRIIQTDVDVLDLGREYVRVTLDQTEEGS